MRCIGKFHDDRTCDLCMQVTELIYEECRKIDTRNKKEFNEIKKKRLTCIHSISCYYDRQDYIGCVKESDYKFRNIPECRPHYKCGYKEKSCFGYNFSAGCLECIGCDKSIDCEEQFSKNKEQS